MEALIYFAIWAGLIFLMMRLGWGAQIMGHDQRQTRVEPGSTGASERRWVPPATDRDPVCGKRVATDKAKPSVHDGRVYYLCSRDCRAIFEAAPHLYTAADEAPQDGLPKNLEHSHV